MPGRSTVKIGYRVDDEASGPIRDLNESMSRTDITGNIIGAALTGGPAAVIFGAANALGELVDDYVDRTLQARRNSRAVNANIEDYTALRYAFEQTGYDGADVDAILFELGVKVNDLREGAPAVRAVFNELNISLADLDSRDSAGQLELILQQLDTVGAHRRGFILDTIFGGDDARKIAALKPEIAELTAEARRFGVAIDEGAAFAVERFWETLRHIEATVEGGLTLAGQYALHLYDSTVGAVQKNIDDAIAGREALLAEFHSRLDALAASEQSFTDAITSPEGLEIQRLAARADIDVFQLRNLFLRARIGVEENRVADRDRAIAAQQPGSPELAALADYFDGLDQELAGGDLDTPAATASRRRARLAIQQLQERPSAPTNGRAGYRLPAGPVAGPPALRDPSPLALLGGQRIAADNISINLFINGDSRSLNEVLEPEVISGLHDFGQQVLQLIADSSNC